MTYGYIEGLEGMELEDTFVVMGTETVDTPTGCRLETVIWTLFCN